MIWKALSFKQPWGFDVVYNGKDVDNRPRLIRHYGDFLIHVSASESKKFWAWSQEKKAHIPGLLPRRQDDPVYKRGGIIGRAKVVQIIDGDGLCLLTRQRVSNIWHMPGSFGYVLTNVKPLPFVVCQGHLGFWKVPADVVTQLELEPREEWMD